MKIKSPGRIFIGTSNITLPGNKSTFPKEFQNNSRLHYYSNLFNTVELNSTFYKVPMASTFDKWANDTLKDFKFSAKLWKGITHVKHLHFDKADITSFTKRASSIGSKKGCLLLQFPGKITFDYFSKVENILELLQDSAHTDNWQVAVEFRNGSWYTGETFELIDEFNASLVLHDLPKGENGEINKNAKVLYMRLHGPDGNYKGSYEKDFLISKGMIIQQWIKKGKDAYVYFNNTAGDAFNNAVTLQQICNEFT